MVHLRVTLTTFRKKEQDLNFRKFVTLYFKRHGYHQNRSKLTANKISLSP